MTNLFEFWNVGWWIFFVVVGSGIFIIIYMNTHKNIYKPRNKNKFLYFDKLTKIKTIDAKRYEKYKKEFCIHYTEYDSKTGTILEHIIELQRLTQTFENAKGYFYPIEKVTDLINKIDSTESELKFFKESENG